MAWVVTITVVDCASTSTFITGAGVRSGTVFIGTTDINGQLIIVVDDVWEFVILTIQKGSISPCLNQAQNPAGHPGYIDKNVTIHANQDGQSIQVCLSPAPWPNCAATGTSCFIVSATTGSPDSEEVNALRALRDRVSAKSALAAQLIAAFYDEYESFSPEIAADLQLDTTTREVVLQLVVRPLIAWFNLAGTLGFGEPEERVRQRKQELSDACLRPLADAVLAQLVAVRDGSALAHAPPMLRELAPRIAPLRFATWALLDPLVRAWTSVRDGLDSVEQVAEWLSAAPLEALSTIEALPTTASADSTRFERDLSALASFFDFRPRMKARLGERLSKAWPDAASAVQRAGLSHDQNSQTKGCSDG